MEDHMPEAKKRGRPPKPVEDRRRNNVTIRLRDATKAQLEVEASRSQRSVSDEVETRLEQSFRAESLFNEILQAKFGRPLTGLLLAMGYAMHEAGRMSAFQSTYTLEGMDAWAENAHAFDQAAKAASHVLEAFRPYDEIVTPPQAALSPVEMGQGFANGILGDIAGRPATEEGRRRGDEIRPLLGSLAEIKPQPKQRRGSQS